jgi:hypothetical protein
MKHRLVGLAASLAVIPITAAAASTVSAAAPPNPPAQIHGGAAANGVPQPPIISPNPGGSGQLPQPPVNPGGPSQPYPPVVNPGGPIQHPQPPVNPGGPDRPAHPDWGWRGHRDWAPGHHPEPRHWSDRDDIWNYWYGRGFHDGWLGLHHRHDLGGERQQAYDQGYHDGAEAADND